MQTQQIAGTAAMSGSEITNMGVTSFIEPGIYVKIDKATNKMVKAVSGDTILGVAGIEYYQAGQATGEYRQTVILSGVAYTSVDPEGFIGVSLYEGNKSLLKFTDEKLLTTETVAGFAVKIGG